MAWTCQRQTAGRKCKTRNSNRKKLCETCGKPRPPRKRPDHLDALEIPYEAYVALNGGERCGVCGRPRSAVRRLDRDHDHATGRPRGLLCPLHNRWLASWVTPELLRAALAYLERDQNKK